MRKDSVDYVLHLGDYIYEYKNGDYGWGNSYGNSCPVVPMELLLAIGLCIFYSGRIPQPDREIYTLYDYRRRLAQYRTDLDLLLSHNQYAWITVWVTYFPARFPSLTSPVLT